MLCQFCQKNLANVQLIQIINNKKIEMYLCESCAKLNNQTSLDFGFDLSEFFIPFINVKPQNVAINDRSKPLECNKCGMALDEFKKNGKLGCDNCYNTFSGVLSDLIKRIHGSVKYNGKVPNAVLNTMRSSNEMKNLKTLLDTYIKNEEYEKAAVIRDKIKALELEISQNSISK